MSPRHNDPFTLAQFAFQGEAQGQDQGQDQGQGQLNAQANLQGEAQGQLNAQDQGQGQGQDQGQGQGEAQAQGQSSQQSSSNDSDNGNGNLNLNGNGNLNASGNLNGNGNLNLNGNENSNSADNGLSNSASNQSGNLSFNGVVNGVDNDITNKVNVSVNVDASVHADPGIPTESSVLHMDGLHIDSLDGSFLVMPDFGSQSLSGDGNNFHLDQVNNLVSNGYVSGVSDGIMTLSSSDGGFGDPGCFTPESFGGGHGGSGSPFSFSQSASATGGGATDATNVSGGDHGVATGSANAAATLTQEAFTQHIVLGSNIQYNTMPISVVGGDSYADGAHDIAHH